MGIYRKRSYFTDISEHFLRLSVRHKLENVKGDVIKEWHRKTNKWLTNDCTKEEAELIRNYYLSHYSIMDCTDDVFCKKLAGLIEKYAVAVELASAYKKGE